ncbi:MAG TPA: tetratricopeptide repeat protein, partial [Acetobacteraceae bacterium]|nr:tetratricopeptide repeat protein [Acetobacteraceae bacterium]
MRRISLLVGLAALPALAQEPPQPAAPATTRPVATIDLLLQQAQRWIDQGRVDLAALSVQRALAAEPQNAAALLAGVRVEVARSSREAAGGYLARLRNAQPSREQLAAAESEVRAAGVDRNGLEQARRLAREGRSDEAASAYRAAFGNREPPGQYAREYYEVLAGSATGRATGQRALSELAAQPGADDRTVLADAEQLTYSPATRASGLRRLAHLTSKPAVAEDAQRAWRQALGFYQNDPAAISLYEEYLRRFPDDTVARQRLEAIRANPAGAATPGDTLRERAYAELGRGRVRNSADTFESALALDPSDPDALGGLGIVRLRENRPNEARALLQRAAAANPAAAGKWRRALDAADYALELADARQALQRGRADAAEAIARRAASREVDDNTDAQTLLGDAALKRGDKTSAEQYFRAALSKRPGFGPAKAGLAKALGSSPPAADPQATDPAIRPTPTSADAELARLRQEATRTSDPRAAAIVLRTAMARAPADPWLRLDLARALVRDG